ncbi:MAG: hypothetical protein DME24_14845 [Verrucomicrobia bacterium]|nr:MAG: hypothetical protein DME24_14845 [Verrucomicrobiota bacterium]
MFCVAKVQCDQALLIVRSFEIFAERRGHGICGLCVFDYLAQKFLDVAPAVRPSRTRFGPALA